jgi:hypothetical protein
MSKLKRISSYLLYGIIAVSLVIFVLYFIGTITEGTMLVWSYILVAVSALTSVLFPLAFLIMNPKKAKSALLGIVALLLIIGIAYVTADSTIPKFVGSEAFNITEGLSKNIGMAFSSIYILFAVAVAVILYSEISKYFK